MNYLVEIHSKLLTWIFYAYDKILRFFILIISIYCTVPESQRGCQGVGVLLSSRLVIAVVEYKAINSRLFWVRFKLGIPRVLLAAYAPVSSAPLGELEQFWESAKDVLGSVRGNEKIIICEDFNGWVGQYSDMRINEAGKLILEICILFHILKYVWFNSICRCDVGRYMNI